MQNKTAVQFRKARKVSHTFQRLKYCKSCGAYTVLFDSKCPSCQAANAFVSVEEHADMLNRRQTHTETLLLVSLVLTSVFLTRDLSQIIIAPLAGVLLMLAHWGLRRRYKPYYERYRLQKLLARQAPLIFRGLDRDFREAIDDVNKLNYKEAYEKLREIGTFIASENIRAYKVFCLNHFVIRKDMELELESVIPATYDYNFVAYLYEVSKVNKQLIRQSVLDYALKHREQIELLDNGKEILTNLVAASLRMKHFLKAYSSLIIDYIELLPKDRFLRLCKMLAGSTDAELAGLTAKCKESARLRYSFDPEFQGLW